jgi:hypothetical protein
LFFRFPPQNLKLRNLANLIKHANHQVKTKQGCIFLKVPFFLFKDSLEETKKLFSKGYYSNIGAVKIVSLKNTFHPEVGVETERNEAIVINPTANIPIKHPILDNISGYILFNKYKEL